MLRIIVLDGVYNQARAMFKAIKSRLTASNVPPFIALHPKTLSVYHRALKKYSASSSVSIAASKDPEALRICTVEACALMLQELGENKSVIDALGAVLIVIAVLVRLLSLFWMTPPSCPSVFRCCQ